MNLVHLDEKNFQKEIVEESLPVLVDFYASWCGPCKMVAPIIEELAKEYKGKFKFAKVNVEDAGSIANRFTIMSVPTFLLFKGGKVVDQFAGALSKKELKSKIDACLA